MKSRIWLFADGSFHVAKNVCDSAPLDYKTKRHKCIYRDRFGEWYELLNAREYRKIPPPKDIEMRLLLLGVPNE